MQLSIKIFPSQSITPLWFKIIKVSTNLLPFTDKILPTQEKILPFIPKMLTFILKITWYHYQEFSGFLRD